MINRFISWSIEKVLIIWRAKPWKWLSSFAILKDIISVNHGEQICNFRFIIYEREQNNPKKLILLTPWGLPFCLVMWLLRPLATNRKASYDQMTFNGSVCFKESLVSLDLNRSCVYIFCKWGPSRIEWSIWLTAEIKDDVSSNLIGCLH